MRRGNTGSSSALPKVRRSSPTRQRALTALSRIRAPSRDPSRRTVNLHVLFDEITSVHGPPSKLVPPTNRCCRLAPPPFRRGGRLFPKLFIFCTSVLALVSDLRSDLPRKASTPDIAGRPHGSRLPPDLHQPPTNGTKQETSNSVAWSCAILSELYYTCLTV